MTYTFAQLLYVFKTDMIIKYPPVAIQIRKVQELTKVRGGHERGNSERYAGGRRCGRSREGR